MAYVHTSTVAPNPLSMSVSVDIKPDPAFTRRFSPRVKAIGGSYGACRGWSDARHVHLPANPKTIALLEEILAVYKPGWRRSSQDKYYFVFGYVPEIRKYNQTINPGKYLEEQLGCRQYACTFEEACASYVREYEAAVATGRAKSLPEILQALATSANAHTRRMDNGSTLHKTLTDNGMKVIMHGHQITDIDHVDVVLSNGIVLAIGVRADGFQIEGVSRTTGGHEKPRLFDLEQTMHILKQVGALTLS